ncbi:MAG: hypothetical protein PVI90_09715 [Desulfobacteraceae bacterium]
MDQVREVLRYHHYAYTATETGQENNTKKSENLATTNFGQWFRIIFLHSNVQRFEIIIRFY